MAGPRRQDLCESVTTDVDAFSTERDQLWKLVRVAVDVEQRPLGPDQELLDRSDVAVTGDPADEHVLGEPLGDRDPGLRGEHVVVRVARRSQLCHGAGGNRRSSSSIEVVGLGAAGLLMAGRTL